MTLNTYAASVPYLTVPPRQRVNDSHNVLLQQVVPSGERVMLKGFTAPLTAVSPDIALTDNEGLFTKAVTLHTGKLWHGYDEYACFEAAVTVWLAPPTTGNVYLGGVYQHRHRLNMPYGKGFPASLATNNFPVPIDNDYYELKQLSDLASVPAPLGSRIVVNRDLFNIEWAGSALYNAWDIEVIIVVDE